MANEINIYQPRYLAEVVRQAPPLHTFFLSTFFTNVKTFSSERVDIDIVQGDRHMAAFVHPKVGGEILKDEGYRTESYAPPLINPCDITTADRYLKRLPGENIYSGKTPAMRAAEKLVEEYTRLNDAATRREEWMAVQAIVNGYIPIVGKGVNEVIDFGLTNKEKLAGTAQWGKSAAKPIDNLEKWVDAVQTNGFCNVDMAILGKDAMTALMEDEKVQKMLDNRRVELGIINPRTLPNGVRYYGHLNTPDLDLYVYNEKYLDDWTDPDTPAVKPLIPSNAVILISSAANYMRAYGLCTYIDDATKAWVTEETERVLRSYVKHRPDRRELELQTHPLTIPDKLNSWFSATVL